MFYKHGNQLWSWSKPIAKYHWIQRVYTTHTIQLEQKLNSASVFFFGFFVLCFLHLDGPGHCMWKHTIASLSPSLWLFHSRCHLLPPDVSCRRGEWRRPTRRAKNSIPFKFTSLPEACLPTHSGPQSVFEKIASYTTYKRKTAWTRLK